MRSYGSKRYSRRARRTAPPWYAAHWFSRVFPRALWRRVDVARPVHSSEKTGSIDSVRETRADHSKECRAGLSGPNGVALWDLKHGELLFPFTASSAVTDFDIA